MKTKYQYILLLKLNETWLKVQIVCILLTVVFILKINYKIAPFSWFNTKYSNYLIHIVS